MNLFSMACYARYLMGIFLACAICGVQAQEPVGADAAQPDETQAQMSAPDVAAASSSPMDAPPATTAETVPDTIPVPSVAADSTATSSPEPESGEATRLDDVVVTATKRAQPVRKIAATVNVLSGEDLEREGVQSIDQILQLVPGVNLIDDGSGGTPKRITIRGISTASGANPTAGTLFGDVPVSDVFLPKVQIDPNPFDMATVEVLKGPQGTLFGGAGLNGLIRYVPEAPQLDEFRVKYYTQLLSYPGNGGNAWNYGAVVNAPFADNTAAVRLMGFHRDSPGFTDDTRNGRSDINTLEQYGYRAMATWLPAERWKVSLMAVTQHTTEDDVAFADNTEGKLSRGVSPRASPAESNYSLANLGIERSFDWGDLMSQTSYFDKHFDIFLEASYAVQGVVPVLSGANVNHSYGMTQEFRAVSAPSDSPWKWLAGAFYYQNHVYDCSNIGAADGLPVPPILIPGPLTGALPNPCPENVSKLQGQLNIAELSGEVDLEEHALFGEVTRRFGEHWEATLGARGYQNESGGVVTSAGAIYATQNNLMRVARRNTVGERGISPKASIVFAPTDELRSYLTVSRGFRFGGPQIGASTPNTDVPEVYKSDSLWNYELGLRTDWLDRTLRIDVSAYHIDWTDPQVYQQQVLAAGIALGNYIDNVGGAEGNGVEIALRYLPPFLPGLSIDASAAWNRTVTTEQFTSGTGKVVTAGSPWPLSPRWQTATTLAYVQPIMDWQAGASLRHLYLGQACGTIECPAQVFGYHQLDLNLFANAIGESYWPQLSLSLNNLTDERGFTGRTVNPAPAASTVSYIAPRTLVLRLSGNF